MAEGTAKFSDNWNYIKVVMTESVNVKANKSTINTKLYAVVPHSNGTPAYINTNFTRVYIPGQDFNYGWVNIPASSQDQSLLLAESNYDVAHNSQGKGSFSYTSGVVTSGGGSPSVYLSFNLTDIDRTGITISNYTLRDCISRQLYINFTFNAVPKADSIKYRYKKSTDAEWESDWITYDQYGGSYDSNTKTGYFVTPKLQANTNYEIEIKTTRNYNDVSTTKTGTFFVESSIYFKTNDTWVDGEVYIKVSDTWKKGIVYLKHDGTWEEAG